MFVFASWGVGVLVVDVVDLFVGFAGFEVLVCLLVWIGDFSCCLLIVLVRFELLCICGFVVRFTLTLIGLDWLFVVWRLFVSAG